MFLYEIPQEDSQSYQVFLPGKNPKLAKLSHSYNNPYWSYPYHVHKDDTELIYFSEGKAKYSVDTEVYDVKKGDIMIVNHGSIHSVTSDPDHPISVWTCSVRDFYMASSDTPDYFLPSDRLPIMKAGRHEAFIMALFLELEYYSKKHTAQGITICNDLSTALGSIYHAIFQKAKASPLVKKQSFVQDILMYINEHYMNQITLDRLSKEFNMSSHHISHKFQEVYGISPINYVIDRRISSAKWLLINTEDSLVSIGQQVGYDNTHHFAKLFEKRTGYAPLDYREEFKSEFDVEELDIEI